jgi:hypothetical protein
MTAKDQSLAERWLDQVSVRLEEMNARIAVLLSRLY